MTTTIPSEELARAFADEYVIAPREVDAGPASGPTRIGILSEGSDEVALWLRREEALAVAARINRLAVDLPPQRPLVVPDHLVRPLDQDLVEHRAHLPETIECSCGYSRPLKRPGEVDEQLRRLDD